MATEISFKSRVLRGVENIVNQIISDLILPEKRDLQKEMEELQAQFNLFLEKNPHIRVFYIMIPLIFEGESYC